LRFEATTGSANQDAPRRKIALLQPDYPIDPVWPNVR